MCRIKAKVEEGLMPSERVVRIPTAEGGSEEFTVSARQVQGETVVASCIGIENGRVLVEMPRESAAGKWRNWVDADTVIRS